MSKCYNGLPKWSHRTAKAVFHSGQPAREVMESLGVEFSPNSVRIVQAAIEDHKVELHHLYAQQVALIASKGNANSYARWLVKWTALESLEGTEAEFRRVRKKCHDVGLDVVRCSEEQRRRVIGQLQLVGLVEGSDGYPVWGIESRRAEMLTQSYMHAYQAQDMSNEQSLARLLERANGSASEKEKKEQQEAAEVDGLMSWLDEEEPGKTIPVEEPPVISRMVTIHSARMKTATKSGATDDDLRIKMREALAKKMQIGAALDRHRLDEIYAELYVEAPWHARVIEWLWRRHLETLDDPERCSWLPPSMIIGPPGCGKTFLLTRLAEMLELPAVRMDMTGSLEPWPIAGGAWGWRNAQPGLAVKTVLESGFANPVLLLDEVEKAGKSQHGGPLDALLPLLQRETARSYRCPYLEAEIDLSRVSWIMLGNALAPISGPLRDRVKVMMARGPEGAEIRVLVERLLGALVADGQVINATVGAMKTGKMTLRGLHRLAREFRAIEQRPQLN